MINFGCNIKVKHNYKNFNAIMQKLPQTAGLISKDILDNIRGNAIRLEKGHNENGILVEMIDMSTKEVKGRIYADPSKFMTGNGQSYLWFEYFGTGQYAEQDHIGKTKHFIESRIYRMVYPCEQSRKNVKLSYSNNKRKTILCSNRIKSKPFFRRCRI